MRTTDRERLTARIIEEWRNGKHPDLPSVHTTMDAIWERQRKEGR